MARLDEKEGDIVNRSALIPLAMAAIVCAFFVAGFAWDADFTPSSYQPAVGETVTFAICDTCFEDGSYRYEWDFDGDGTMDLETTDLNVTYTYEEGGFYEVRLTMFDGDGRWGTKLKGILVGDFPAYAVRETVDQGDGTIFVLLTITVLESISAPGIEESMPRGWQFELLDGGGAITNANGQDRVYEAVWGSQLEGGEELTFSYRLHPAGAMEAQLQGTLSGLVEGRFVAEICGDLEVQP